MEKDTLTKFLNNRCSKPELDEIVRWADTNAFDKESINWGLENWTNQESNGFADEQKFSLLFDRIQQRISSTASEELRKQSIGYSVFTWITRAAAVLLVPVLLFSLYMLSQNYQKSTVLAGLQKDSLEIIAPIGSRVRVQLPDGSIVSLNYGSKIKYPQVFSGNTRSVLLSGEGFFEVAHNPQIPFIVKTRDLNIKAVGTSFNVMAYPEEPYIEATLVSGKIIVDKQGRGMKNIGAMTPGQHLNYNSETGRIVCIKEGNIEKYIAWKDGKIIFEDTPILQVVEKLNRIYNVDITVTDEVKDYVYTVTFEDEPLPQILDLMTLATPISYKILPRGKRADGTFSKQEIIIEKRF